MPSKTECNTEPGQARSPSPPPLDVLADAYAHLSLSLVHNSQPLERVQKLTYRYPDGSWDETVCRVRCGRGEGRRDADGLPDGRGTPALDRQLISRHIAGHKYWVDTESGELMDLEQARQASPAIAMERARKTGAKRARRQLTRLIRLNDLSGEFCWTFPTAVYDRDRALALWRGYIHAQPWVIEALGGGYVMICERCAKGQWHIHAAVGTRWILAPVLERLRVSWIRYLVGQGVRRSERSEWARVKFTPKRKNTEALGRYLSKYLGKGFGNEALPPGTHRYESSQGLLRPVPTCTQYRGWGAPIGEAITAGELAWAYDGFPYGKPVVCVGHRKARPVCRRGSRLAQGCARGAPTVRRV